MEIKKIKEKQTNPYIKKGMKPAFSVLELIFVIVILGIVATVAVPKLMDTKSDASVSTIRQDIATVVSSVQSYYMTHNKIDKISDSVSLNSKIWNIEDTQVTYIENDNPCVTIKVDDNILSVTIDKDSGTVCSKLFNSGIVNTTYELY